MSLYFTWSLDTAVMVFMLALICPGLPAVLLWERRHAHPALYTLGRPLLRPSGPLLISIVGAVLTLTPLLRPQAYSLPRIVIPCAVAAGIGLNPPLTAIGSWRITDEGLFYPLGTIRWWRIRSWRWTDAPDRPGVKVLEVKLSRFHQLRWRIVPGHEELITELLSDNLDDVPAGGP